MDGNNPERIITMEQTIIELTIPTKGYPITYLNSHDVIMFMLLVVGIPSFILSLLGLASLLEGQKDSAYGKHPVITATINFVFIAVVWMAVAFPSRSELRAELVKEVQNSNPHIQLAPHEVLSILEHNDIIKPKITLVEVPSYMVKEPGTYPKYLIKYK